MHSKSEIKEAVISNRRNIGRQYMAKSPSDVVISTQQKAQMFPKPVFTLLFLVAAVVLQQTSASAQQPDNAAEVYKQAFQAVPATPEFLNILTAENPSPEQIKSALAAGGPALSLLHKATTLSKCDWGVDTSGKSKVNLAFLNPLRPLHAVLVLQVQSQIAAGNVKGAIATLTDSLMLGRRLQQMPLLITRLLGWAYEKSAIESIAEYLPRFDAMAIRDVSATFVALPAPVSLDDAFAAEKRVLGAELPAKSVAFSKAAELRSTALRAMFTAVLAAPQGKEADFKSTHDSVGGGPFRYRAIDGGYELISAVPDNAGKPITLVVGKSAAK
ncbi:MAG TPA: hypothetical protein VFE47_21065 [Tepidisphaeraceae bacterium]|jgi:hypothetical protein|nr:hypothetical protein [Tepidisphaeraceae bacterium]